VSTTETSVGKFVWHEQVSSDPQQAQDFYTRLFGWDAARGDYSIFQLRGRDVAGIGARAGLPPAWTTYVWVDDVDETVAKAREAGGNVVMKPFDALDGGRIALLSDPTGGVIAAWQVGDSTGAQIVNEPGAWSMSFLHTRDLDAARAFYAAVFGWTYESFASMTMACVPGYIGGVPEQPVSRETAAVLTDMTGLPDDVPPHWRVDFWVVDLDAALARATELGGSVVSPPTETPGFRSGVIADPQGAVMTLSQLTAPSA
jgi:predicted enzyme related to lactoylglutathione lyase